MTAKSASAELPCRHERSHIVDSCFFRDGYSTADSRRILCDLCRLQRWIDVEVALAGAQSDLGLIPEWAASKIAEVARLELIDLARVQEGIQATGHSLVPLLRELSAACGEACDFVHFGATTQDIQDSAQSLEMRDVLDAVDRELSEVIEQLGYLASEHGGTVMTGRTHAQPALPTTFGLKVAGWMDELLRHKSRLREARPRLLVAQLFGGVGTMAALGVNGPALLERFAAKLELGVPLLGWHVSRDRIAEYVGCLAMVTGTLARVADEVRTLSRPEFGELELSFADGHVGSSTMPHKHNPEGCEQVVVLARLARAQVGLALDAMIVDHERDYRGTRLEWCAVTDVSHYALAALNQLRQSFCGLQVHARRMAERVHAFRDQLCTEALMMAVARHLGRERAHRIVARLSRQSIETRTPLREGVLRCPELAELFDVGTLERIFDPGDHVGASELLVKRVVSAAESVLDRSLTSRILTPARSGYALKMSSAVGGSVDVPQHKGAQ